MSSLERLESYRRALAITHCSFPSPKVSVTWDDARPESAENIELVLHDLLEGLNGRQALLDFIRSRMDELKQAAAEEAKEMLLLTMSPEEIRAWAKQTLQEQMRPEEIRDWADEVLVREVMET